jgi:hypothetical protein
MGLPSRRRRETVRAVNEFEDGGGCLVFFDGFDAEDAGVATGTVQEAFTEGAEEFGDERVGFL